MHEAMRRQPHANQTDWSQNPLFNFLHTPFAGFASLTEG